MTAMNVSELPFVAVIRATITPPSPSRERNRKEGVSRGLFPEDVSRDGW